MAQHIDSPCANVKQNKWPRLPILTAEMESSSDESDENCGYDPDSESDDQDDESNRILISKYLDSPESLREAPACVEPPMARSPPTFKLRTKAPSVVNLEQLLRNKNSTKVMASTMLDGQQFEEPLDFVPDVSSVDKREHFKGMDKSEARNTMESVSFAKPENQKSTFLIKKTSTPGEEKRPKERWEGLSSIHSSEAGGSLLVPRQQREILTDEECGWSSHEILPGTPQSYASQEILPGTPQSYASQEILPGTPQNYASQEILPGTPQNHASQDILPGTPQNHASQEILPGTPQNHASQEILPGTPQSYASQEILPGTPLHHAILTFSRKEASAKRVARTSRRGDTETLVDIKQQNETIANESKDNCNESDDNLITIEDGDSPTSNSTATSKLEESIKLCEFPVGQPGAVIVAMQDYATLDSETFVNDVIIDFYIKFLEHNVLPSADQSSVQIFSTMFYKRLMQSPKKISKILAFFETDPALTTDEKRHYRVSGWTKNVDLFSMKMIIVPICQSAHWFLLIIVNPGALVNPVGSVGAPHIVVLDSLGGHQTSAVNNLRDYLGWEWKKRKRVGGELAEEIKCSSKEMPAIYPDKPEQENGVDCGVFLLHYVEKIFQNVLQLLSPNLIDLSTWFTMEEVGQKRTRIAELIRQLAKQQNSQRIINYPDIKPKTAMQLRSNEKPDAIVTNDNDDVVLKLNHKDLKDKSVIAKQGVSNVKQKQNIKRATKRPQKMLESSILIPNTVETTMSRVRCPSPRMRRHPLQSSGVKEESTTCLNFVQLLEGEKLKQVETKTQSDTELRNNESVENEIVKNTSQSDLEDTKQDTIEKELDSKLRLMEALKRSLLLISPERSKLEGSHEVAANSSALYRSPDLSLKEANLRDEINQPSTDYSKKVASLSSLSSNGELSTTDTSADLFSSGRGIFHVVSCPKENERSSLPRGSSWRVGLSAAVSMTMRPRLKKHSRGS